MNSIDARLRQLVRTFDRIHQDRMHGLPFLNPALRVESVGFRPWDDHLLGVLITPWFMNLMLLPVAEGNRASAMVGSKSSHRFPSGIYEFIRGREAGLGDYLSCSLFSPVFNFPDQAEAVTTAKAVLSGLMDSENREEISMREQEIQTIWGNGTEQREANAAVADPQSPTGITRRALLTGDFSEPQEQP